LFFFFVFFFFFFERFVCISDTHNNTQQFLVNGSSLFDKN
jgi:hypothetical protein